MPVLGSPFASSNTAKRLPAVSIGDSKVVIRLDDSTDTDRVLIVIDPQNDASPANASIFLNAGESVEINGRAVGKASDISIISANGTGNVYWGIV
jgi:hypothetical protein